MPTISLLDPEGWNLPDTFEASVAGWYRVARRDDSNLYAGNGIPWRVRRRGRVVAFGVDFCTYSPASSNAVNFLQKGGGVGGTWQNVAAFPVVVDQLDVWLEARDFLETTLVMAVYYLGEIRPVQAYGSMVDA